MFEDAERGLTLSERAYEKAVESLRTKLLAAHFALRATRRQVILVLSGVDGSGKGGLVHRLNEWLDPRGVTTHAFWDDSDEESERPHFYRYWKAMPGAGRIGILFGSWYTLPIVDRVTRKRRKREFSPELDRIVAFERMLTDGNATLVKLWLHLTKAKQEKELEEDERDGTIGPDDWKHHAQYDRFREVSERALAHTSTPFAPWHVIDASDRRHREVAAGKVLLAALEAALATEAERERAKSGRKPASRTRAKPVAREYVAGPSILSRVDLSQRLTPAEYERELERLQSRLARLTWAARERKVATVLAFEGWDAAGKGSSIRRLTQAIDPRLFRVVGIAAPTEEERAQHYLWRFWRHIPRDGRVMVFDRTWYGRVLVERVEGFATVAEWDRSYGEINAFEQQLTEHGIALVKFWLHISPEEQMRRFKERQRVVYKRHKITEEDWRNRAKLEPYREAVEEMLARCDAPKAPWVVIAGNDKRFARVAILRAAADRLERALD